MPRILRLLEETEEELDEWVAADLEAEHENECAICLQRSREGIHDHADWEDEEKDRQENLEYIYKDHY